MRLETSKNRLEQRCRTAMQLTDTHERLREAQLAAQAQEDGFLRMCWANHQEAMERDAKRQAPVIAPQPVRQVKPEQPVGRLRRKTECFLSGMSIGAAVMLLIVWLLLLAAGVI